MVQFKQSESYKNSSTTRLTAHSLKTQQIKQLRLLTGMGFAVLIGFTLISILLNS